ncbi:rhomboid family intramembrane serine protease GlpG [Lacimicrobium alkaliphilum]|uniref:Rhomboid family intramembrane serine protease GlpG n=1 Tax=Lacimicrobium alkaliphilum TaxID=1526571 RepID=A0A0U3B129_9ALTE|nr:rhomboid family intramembrane serine protease GlpG [Lacimicrobium alkaliphilum]ALT00096.1 rhomboid family intramembrane serine protease GlpG [Lacimicrobium alkaliphilum]
MLLIAFTREQDARLLANYLKFKGIQVNYEFNQAEHPHSLVLLDESQLPEARAMTQEFIHNPQDQKYQQVAWQQGAAVSMQGSGQKSLLSMLSQGLLSPLTSIVLILCLLVYFASILGWFVPLQQWLAFQPLSQLSDNQQWWRLLGPAFMHFSVLHIVFNLLWWGMLGAQIEQRLGSINLLLIFLLTAVFSNFAQYMASGPNFGGLSGVVYGVMGFVWWCGVLRPGWGLSLSKPLVGFILVWLILGYTDMLWVKMANTAHTVGLITGCLLALLYTRLSVNPDKDT